MRAGLKGDSSLSVLLSDDAQQPGSGVPKRPVRLADQLYERILKQIVGGDLPKGEKIPSEARFCELYGVSRPVVREAISRLQADGLVLTRQGAGTYVAKRPGADLLRLAPIGGLADLMRCYEIRIALEGEAASLAALRHDPQTMVGIEKALLELKRVIEAREVGVDADHQFHLAIAKASQNDLFVQSLNAISSLIFTEMRVARTISITAADPERLQIVQAEHVAIVQAIRAMDAEGARQAMRQHIGNARGRILASS
jgi:GntR family transcriptional repressor for pyruvate dehydrogenase complex